MKRPSWVVPSWMVACVLLTPAMSRGQDNGPEPLTVATWGGAYEESQRRAYFAPFTEATGIPIKTVHYDGGITVLQEHLASGEVEWDVIDMIQSDASAACDAGLLAPIDPGILAPAPDGTPAQEDFMQGAINRCFITQIVFSTVIAFDDRAFPGVKPDSVEDFFDLQTFPGKRALRKAPVGLAEWALLSLSVPQEQLYDLLSTRRGLDLAARRLDEIRDSIIWWTRGVEPVELLTSGRAAMATGYNGRFFHARVMEGAPISVIWDGQLIGFNSWTILRGTDQAEQAARFIAFATRAENMAAQASLISYGPARKSAQQRVGLHTDVGVPMMPYMPTAAAHMERAVIRDHRWYSQTGELREQWFREWLGAGQTSE
ncbi:extracellular solute-binding protein [Marinobacter persicus]|uniref:Spermidine/putrescine transport system substrate-binding protein n=1 Tax=Marinobacter persicus TaxID=930118 RepID=A0A2S6G3A1_9GAMM|nr:extracellular solute-binding protein [Marinobacter persicus]PPK50201.1 putative spermidine/putrescine transport system substrate-binding protein [Marinobacter persicus]PPK52658.1 putative spermidine/putrescine transport system substrate-binding protein [Marinobacter persicus]PPK56694.1 putative spermidine/putrescine transport system substrate-binding protein [Marinobacter persicus]